MHFGEFNPLEVLAAAAVQRGGSAIEGNSNSPNSTSSNNNNEPGETEEDSTDDTNQKAKVEVSKNELHEKNSNINSINLVPSNKSVKSELKPLTVVTSSGSGKTGPNAASYVIKMVTSNGNKVTTTRSVMALKDATKIVIPNKDGSSKTLTVLKINKPSISKTNQPNVLGDKPKGDEDEGYCSRSSMDSPGQCSRSDSELCEQDLSDVKSPSNTSKGIISPPSIREMRMLPGSNLTPNKTASKKVLLSPVESGKKSAKIVIVGKDSTVKTVLNDQEEKSEIKTFCKPLDPVVTSNNSHGAVLRSLLGEKSTVVTSDKPQSLVLSSAASNLMHAKAGPLKGVTVIPAADKKQKVNNKCNNEVTSGENMPESVLSVCGSPLSGTVAQGNSVHEGLTDDDLQNKPLLADSCNVVPNSTENIVISNSSGIGNHQNDVSEKTLNICDKIIVKNGEQSEQNNDSGLKETCCKLSDNSSTDVNSSGSSDGAPNAATNSSAVRVVNSKPADADMKTVSPVIKVNANSCSDKNESSLNDNPDSATNKLESDSEDTSKDSSNSETFQNAFRSFITSGKPVAEIKGNSVVGSKCDSNAIVLPQNVLTSLNSGQGSKITVVSGGPASQLVTSIASQVLATSQSLQLAQSTCQSVNSSPAVVAKEEVIDILGVTENQQPYDTKESLKLASGAVSQPAKIGMVSTSASSNMNLVTNTVGSKLAQVAKTIPVLINTANGKRLANVPVSSLVSTSTGHSQKPVTYLVMPPSHSKGASLLLPQQINKPQTAQAPKYQYIIQDDVPPIVSTTVSQSPTINIVNMTKPNVASTSNSWTFLTTVDQQGIVANTSQGLSAMTVNAGKSVNVPVLIKKPLAAPAVGTTVLQNSVLVSSKGPQSIIPKLTGLPAVLNHGNILVNRNDVLKTQQSTPVLEIPQLGGQSVVMNIDSPNLTRSVLEVVNHSKKGNQIDPKLISLDTESSQYLDHGDLSGEVFFTPGHKGNKRSKTPVGKGATGRITPLHSLETSPKENTINIKITGSKVIDMRTSEDLALNTKKGAASIGKFGSLSTSWGGFQKSDSVPSFIGTSLTTSRVSSPMFDSATTSPTSSLEPWSPNPMSPLQIKSDSELDVESITRPRTKLAVGSTKGGHTYCKKKYRRSSSSTLDLLAGKEGAVPRLHPLIDHDYGMFSEFSADIQSSIIATTESKKKIEKYNQKAKAARTTKETLFKLDKSNSKLKKRKYTHRLPIDEIRKIRQEKALERQSLAGKVTFGESLLLANNEPSILGKVVKSDKNGPKKQAALDKKLMKPRMSKRRDGRNYVKITGSFQDDFVYYATKNSRGRPRKYHDSTTPKIAPLQSSLKKPPVGGINVFDWYRDLSQTDKSSKFGILDNSTTENCDDFSKIDPNINGVDERLSIPKSKMAKGGNTPMHESEVADLVMQMMPSDEPDYSNSLDFVVPANPVAQSETVVTTGSKEEQVSGPELSPNTPSESQQTGTDNPENLDDMAEQVRSLLNSLGEAELNMLTEKLGNDIPSNTQSVNDKETESNEESTTISLSDVENNALSDVANNINENGDYSGLNAFLGPYNRDSVPSLAPVNNNASFDLDDINDSDLLPSDTCNINTLLGDLNNVKTNSSETPTGVSNIKYSQPSLESPARGGNSLSLLFGDGPLKPLETDADQAEQRISSLKSISEHPSKFNSPKRYQSIKDNSIIQRPPELTTVSMYWNDLPGLMINEKQCVRLVDIHKQMLPAKDTGILKKRCQMMNLEIINCSELERDFLIRYANAAKSKSCVVVAKEDAQALVSFYVNPRPRLSSAARQSVSESRESSAERFEGNQQHTVGQFTSTTLIHTQQEAKATATSPKQTGGKGKGRSRSGSHERSSTPTSGKGKGKSGGKGQKRKASPPTIITEVTCLSSGINVSVPVVQPSRELQSQDMFNEHDDASVIKRSERTRNRKIDYAALNAGLHADENSEFDSSQDFIEETLVDEHGQLESEHQLFHINNQKEHKSPINNNQKVIKMGSSLLKRVVLIKNSPVLKPNGISNVAITPVPGETSLENHYNFQEEIEIRRLRNKQKRRGLNNAEKRKLKKLRERLRFKVKNLKRKIDTLKKNNGLATSPKKILIKSMKTVQAKQRAILQQVVPGISANSVLTPNPLKSIIKAETNSSIVQQALNIIPCDNSLKTDPNSSIIKLEKDSSCEPSLVKNSEMQPQFTPDVKPPIKKEMFKEVHTSRGRTPQTVPTKVKAETKSNKIELRLRSPPNRKVVFPVLHRSNQRGRLQVGNLHFHLYRTKDSSCIQCTTCNDFLSVREFLKHLHHQNIADELCTVTLPQKLEMAVVEPSDEQTRWWSEFERKRFILESSPPSKAPLRTSRRASCEKKEVSPIVSLISSKSICNENIVDDLVSQGLVINPITESALTPVSGTRQSTRVRKRKQLHPIESYVYTSKTAGDQKRLKLDEGHIPLTPTTPITPLTLAAFEPDTSVLPNTSLFKTGGAVVPGGTSIQLASTSEDCAPFIHETGPEDVQIVGDNSVIVG